MEMTYASSLAKVFIFFTSFLALSRFAFRNRSTPALDLFFNGLVILCQATTISSNDYSKFLSFSTKTFVILYLLLHRDTADKRSCHSLQLMVFQELLNHVPSTSCIFYCRLLSARQIVFRILGIADTEVDACLLLIRWQFGKTELSHECPGHPNSIGTVAW